MVVHPGGAWRGVPWRFPYRVLEALVAGCTLLAGVRAEVLYVMRRDACVQPWFAGENAFDLVVSHREGERMRRDERIPCAGQVRVIGMAGPKAIRFSYATTFFLFPCWICPLGQLATRAM